MKCNSAKRALNKDHFREAFFRMLDVSEEEGYKALRILSTFQAVPAAWPTVSSTSLVASPALSPNLVHACYYLRSSTQLSTKMHTQTNNDELN